MTRGTVRAAHPKPLARLLRWLLNRALRSGGAGEGLEKIVTLPSGGRVRIRPISLDVYRWLLSSVQGGRALDKDPRVMLDSPEGIERIEQLRDLVIRAGVLEPKLELEPSDQATPRDFDFDDRVVLCNEILVLAQRAAGPQAAQYRTTESTGRTAPRRS